MALRDDLAAALSLLRLYDVRDFLLGTDALLDAAIVTAPSMHSRAVALEATTVSDAVDPSTFDADFAFNLVTDWLFVPAMQLNAYSLGVHLCKDECRAPARNFKPVLADARFCRYARDLTTGAYVSVASRGAETELVYVPCHANPLRNKGGKWFRFSSQSFQAAMAAIAGADTVPDMDTLLECLSVVYACRNAPLPDVPRITCSVLRLPTGGIGVACCFRQGEDRKQTRAVRRVGRDRLLRGRCSFSVNAFQPEVQLGFFGEPFALLGSRRMGCTRQTEPAQSDDYQTCDACGRGRAIHSSCFYRVRERGHGLQRFLRVGDVAGDH